MTDESTPCGVHLVGGMPLRDPDEIFGTHLIHHQPAVDATRHRHPPTEPRHVAER
jgi:hypothetical protein